MIKFIKKWLLCDDIKDSMTIRVPFREPYPKLAYIYGSCGQFKEPPNDYCQLHICDDWGWCWMETKEHWEERMDRMGIKEL